MYFFFFFTIYNHLNKTYDRHKKNDSKFITLNYEGFFIFKEIFLDKKKIRNQKSAAFMQLFIYFFFVFL